MYKLFPAICAGNCKIVILSLLFLNRKASMNNEKFTFHNLSLTSVNKRVHQLGSNSHLEWKHIQLTPYSQGAAADIALNPLAMKPFWQCQILLQPRLIGTEVYQCILWLKCHPNGLSVVCQNHLYSVHLAFVSTCKTSKWFIQFRYKTGHMKLILCQGKMTKSEMLTNKKIEHNDSCQETDSFIST